MKAARLTPEKVDQLRRDARVGKYPLPLSSHYCATAGVGGSTAIAAVTGTHAYKNVGTEPPVREPAWRKATREYREAQTRDALNQVDEAFRKAKEYDALIASGALAAIGITPE